MSRLRRLKAPEGATHSEIQDALRLSQFQAQRQRNGQEAEDKVAIALMRRGFRLVEKVEVPFGVTQDGRRYAKRKVSGDYRATEPGSGRSVLVESKAYDERLPWSALKPHQVRALDEHMTANGITEVAWTDRGSLRFIPWSLFRKIGFGDRKSVVWTGTTIAIHTSARGKRDTTTQEKEATA